MKSKFITDPQDPSDGFLNTAGAEVYTNFFPWAGNNAGSSFASIPVVILETPALTSEAALSSSAQSGPTSALAMSSGGITINLLFDAAAMAAPASFRAGIQQAASILTSTISDQITVNIKIDYSGTGGGAAAGPDNGLYESYSSVRAELINNATPGDTTFNALPSGSSIQGQSNVAVWNAQLKLFGLLGANDTSTDDGSATFATDINSNLLVGVALHELTHAMGRVPYGPQPDIFDLFRFTSAGTRLFSGSNTAPAAYFSVNGGTTKLADFGKTSDPSDFLNGGVQGSSDPFDEFYSGSTSQSLTTVDKELLVALGFHTASGPIDHPPVVIATDHNLSMHVTVAAPSLFSVTDVDLNPITAYEFWDSTVDPASGHWVVNGIAQGTNVAIDVTAAQLSNTTFQSGSVSDDLWVRANDGFVWGAWTEFHVNVPLNHAPVTTAADFTAVHNQNIGASSLFSVTDSDGDPIIAYRILGFDDRSH